MVDTHAHQLTNGVQLSPSTEAADFPGCEAVPMNAQQFACFDRHVEYWDARREMAWMVCETSVEHERPASRLAMLVHRIAQVRGSAIACCGTVSLHDRGEAGTIQVMEADQTLYVDAARAQALRSPVLVRNGEGPDVVLEVDHTTDARRRKLDLYEEWRIPEIWVEVPDAPARSRPKSRSSGLTIYALDEKTKRYQETAASRVLSGWTAAEIHLALNEPCISRPTWAALDRVGRTLGREEGTTPADDPLLRSMLLEAQEADRATLVHSLLTHRGIELPPAFLADSQPLVRHEAAQIVKAAMACRSAADFLARLSCTPLPSDSGK